MIRGVGTRGRPLLLYVILYLALGSVLRPQVFSKFGIELFTVAGRRFKCIDSLNFSECGLPGTSGGMNL